MSRPEAEEKDFSSNEGNSGADRCGDTEKDVQVHHVADEGDDEHSLSGDESGAERAAAGKESAEERDAGGEEEGEVELVKELDGARAEAQENYDRFLRATAELDNFRKRTAKVRSETREETLRDVLLQIAPILDNMRRGLAQENKEDDAFAQGVELIYNQFQDTLKGYGLEEIGAIGQTFDPTLHEAMMEIEDNDHPPGSVVEEMEKGYKLNNKVVRPARVIVSKAGEENG